MFFGYLFVLSVFYCWKTLIKRKKLLVQSTILNHMCKTILKLFNREGNQFQTWFTKGKQSYYLLGKMTVWWLSEQVNKICNLVGYEERDQSVSVMTSQSHGGIFGVTVQYFSEAEVCFFESVSLCPGGLAYINIKLSACISLFNSSYSACCFQ